MTVVLLIGVSPFQCKGKQQCCHIYIPPSEFQAPCCAPMLWWLYARLGWNKSDLVQHRHVNHMSLGFWPLTQEPWMAGKPPIGNVRHRKQKLASDCCGRCVIPIIFNIFLNTLLLYSLVFVVRSASLLSSSYSYKCTAQLSAVFI